MNEITINLDTKSKIPLYEQIYDHIKTEIQQKKIKCNEKLPSTRLLSSHLEVSRSTIELAYEQLLSEGYIKAVPYKGYYVLRIDELHRLSKKPIAQFEQKQELKEEYIYDFSPYGIDLKSFPYNTWRKLSKEVLVDANTDLFRLGDSQGEYELRNAIMNYLHQSRGVNSVPEQIIVGAGNDYLMMLLGTMVGVDAKVVFENPTYKQAYRLFESLSCKVDTVNMDQYGMCVDQLREKNGQIAYVMPSHQYPLGVVMPLSRRMELLKWAEEAEERYIIEDDYDSELRYKGKPIPALQGADACDKVIYIGTFSRAIAPAIRMSYMVLPRQLLQRYRQKSKFMSSTVSKVDQIIVQKFIEEGHFERHLNKTRAIYKSRHDVLLHMLKPLLNRCVISGEQAGVHLLLTFFNQKEEELIHKAKQKSIKVYGLSKYDISETRDKSRTVILGYANLTEEKIRKAVKILNEIW